MTAAAPHGEIQPATALEAKAMAEAAAIIHNRIVERLDEIPRWRWLARRWFGHALLYPGGAIYEWSAAADRLAQP